MEEWKVYDKNPKYSVSNMGRVRVFCKVKNTQTDLKPKRKGTYSVISGCDMFYALLRNMVAEAWIPNPNNFECVGHINEDTHDNRASNLRWFSKKNGRKPKIPTIFGEELPIDRQPDTIVNNTHTILPIPGTKQWSVYFVEKGIAVHMGIYDTHKEAMSFLS